MTVLDEERCRLLIEKLCSSMGWTVRPAPAVRCVLLDRKGGWITFGQSMAEVVMSLCVLSGTRLLAVKALPAWMLECSSPEELALKAEVAL